MQEWIDFISNVGFPIALVLYFVFKMEKVINNNTVALTEFKGVVERCKR